MAGPDSLTVTTWAAVRTQSGAMRVPEPKEAVSPSISV